MGPMVAEASRHPKGILIGWANRRDRDIPVLGRGLAGGRASDKTYFSARNRPSAARPLFGHGS